MAKKRKIARACSCLAKTNAKLAEMGENIRIDTIEAINFETGRMRTYPRLATYKADKGSRKKQRPVACAYCPFCGKKLPE